MQSAEFKFVRGVKRVYDILTQFKYASIYDKCLTFSDFDKLKVTNAKMLVKFDDVTIATYVLTFETNSDKTYFHTKHRVVSYPDGLTYYVHGKVLTSSNSELLIVPEPANALFSFANTDFIQFRFLRFDTDVSLNAMVKQQVLLIIQNFISNHLMNLGLSCVLNPIMHNATISIFVPSKYHNRVYDYLSKLDWYQILLPFKHLFSKLVLKTDSGEKHFELNSLIPSELQITLHYHGNALHHHGNNLMIEIDFNNDKDYFKNVFDCDNSYDTIDGWSLFPQLKALYTQRCFTCSPIQRFVVYGKVPRIEVHEKHMPIWRVSALKLFGFKLNDFEYWFKQPIYVNRFYSPRHVDAEKWNTYLADNLNRITFI